MILEYQYINSNNFISPKNQIIGKNFSDTINSEFNQNLENFNQNPKTNTITDEIFSNTINFSDSKNNLNNNNNNNLNINRNNKRKSNFTNNNIIMYFKLNLNNNNNIYFNNNYYYNPNN
ncbi:hypothetical protein H8356DRAFT_1385484 [Neocallimastix lanati (nom. inval.)]|nr:hypothetical protein H8356DRAFT_1385484 [Neocallimastix sp. JGI-2020a]